MKGRAAHAVTHTGTNAHPCGVSCRRRPTWPCRVHWCAPRSRRVSQKATVAPCAGGKSAVLARDTELPLSLRPSACPGEPPLCPPLIRGSFYFGAAVIANDMRSWTLVVGGVMSSLFTAARSALRRPSGFPARVVFTRRRVLSRLTTWRRFSRRCLAIRPHPSWCLFTKWQDAALWKRAPQPCGAGIEGGSLTARCTFVRLCTGGESRARVERACCARSGARWRGKHSECPRQF